MPSRNIMKALLAGLCVVALAGNASASRVVIVVAPGADEVERFAAEELQCYLRRITGQEIPVSAEQSKDDVTLLVGGLAGSAKKDLGEEGYVLRSTEGGLQLAGPGRRGTLYAVYDFLERLGCRWYFPDPEDEIVPALSMAEVVRVIRSGLNVEEKPDFAIRMTRFLIYDLGPKDTPHADAAMKRVLPMRVDWLTKNRMNIFQYAIDHTWQTYEHWPLYRESFPEMKKRGIPIGVGGHNMFMHMPAEAFDKHPEWFPMVKGKRTAGIGSGEKHQALGLFCLSNEEACQFYIDSIIKFLKDNPEIEYTAPWPNDGHAGLCECPKCKEKPVTDYLMELHCRLYRKMKEEVPHCRVTYFSYGAHVAPPKKARPLRGMTTTFCPWGRDMNIPFDDPRTRKGHRDVFAQWLDIGSQTGSSLVLHAKYARQLGFGFHPMPLPVLQEDCRWFRAQGLDGFELPCAYMGRRTKAFNIYVLAKLMWDVDADVDAIANDYFEKCYGSCAGDMRKAYEEVEAAQPDLRYYRNLSMRNAPRPPGRPDDNGEYSQETCDYVANAIQHFTQAQGYVEKARTKVKDNAARGRMGRFAESLNYAHIEYQGLAELIKVSDHIKKAKVAKDSKEFEKWIDAAKHVLQAASKIRDQRKDLVATNPVCGLYWDVTGAEKGMRCGGVFQDDQVSRFAKIIGELRKAGLILKGQQK